MPREGLNSDPLLNSDCSNSSWAEMSSYIVGTFQMYPITRDTKQIFILKYLRPIGEYQEVREADAGLDVREREGRGVGGDEICS